MSIARASSLPNPLARPSAPALLVLLAITLSGLLALPRLAAVPLSLPATPAAPALPLVFTERAGVSDGQTVVEAGTIGAAFTFSSAGVSLATPAGATLQLSFPGANPHTSVRAVEPQSAVISSYQGSDPARWSAATPSYGAVVYDELFPGISLHLTGDTRQLKGTYLAGVTQPSDQGIAVSDNAIQPVCGAKIADATGPCDRDAFVAVLNPALTELVAGTYLGGVGTEMVAGIGVDGAGNVYVAGTTGALDFPTRNAFQATWLGADNFSNGFVAKLTPDLSAAVYSTFLGSADQAGTEQIFGLAVDGAGNAAVTGLTNGRQFPVKAAVESELDGRICRTTTERLCYDAFATVFDPSGGLAWSTYLGGDDDDQGRAIAFDGAGGVWVTGQTDASDFAVTAGARPNLQMSDLFLTRLGTLGTPGPGTDKPFKVALPLIR